MVRTNVSDAARDVRVTIRTTPGERDQIDRQRGTLSVSDYLRGLVHADGKRKRLARAHSGG